MKKISMLMPALLLSVVTFGQKEITADSIFNYEPAMSRYQWASQSIASLQFYTTSDVGIVKTGISNTAGGFRLAQLPQQHSVISFESEGIRTLGRFRVYGNFSYSRTSDDSIVWQLQGLPDLNRPYFLAARKAGNFERQQYRINGRVAYEAIPNKLLIGSGFYYLYNTAFRDIDPRPGVKDFELRVSPEVAIIAGKHILGLQPSVGYASENTQTSYRSKKYQYGLDSFPERRTYMVMGMGYHMPRPGSDQNIRTTSSSSGLKLTEMYQRNDWTLQASLAYDWRRYKTGTFLESSLKQSVWGTYTLEAYNFNLGIYKGNQHSLQLSAKVSAGEDINRYSNGNNQPPLNGNNYVYRATDVQLYYAYAGTAQKGLSFGFDAGAELQHSSRQDFLSTQQLDYTIITPAAGGTLNGQLKNNDHFKVKLTAGMYLPLQTTVAVAPLQIDELVTDVLYHDYYYWKSVAGSVGAKVVYISRRIFKTVPAGLSAEVKYIKKLNTDNYPLAEIREVGPYRLQYGVSFNIYL
ncbi:DUF6850 family outer membrane beta-barrel protein [Chitinophaga sp. Cy-1792]|uniref:DUF6850 family outer membrane beta-barrel protein n=1 Tax=Chitinophaga sp. Cy-1792 TaxID=2608339 RepID=UPI0014236F58|nr:DUF6850 family outer membrane beta-barrel protein [Chitinophaga sp. Cy-1792]NIG54380.1 hypothetical protein [Chitinophaga sp. Cy-1792]